MGSISFGPLLFSSEQIATIVSVVAFLVTSWVLGKLVDDSLNRSSSTFVALFFVAARAGYVIEHWRTFSDEPVRALFVWQGGLSLSAGVAALVVATWFGFKDMKLRGLGLVPILVAGVVLGAARLFVPASAGLPLPKISLETVDEQKVSFEGLRGRPLVINLWASWCPPCRRELPMMAEFAHGHDAATFVCANQEESRETIASFLSQQGVTLDTVAMDVDGRLRRYYQARGLPTTLFIDGQGVVHSVTVGEISKEALTDAIDSLK